MTAPANPCAGRLGETAKATLIDRFRSRKPSSASAPAVAAEGPPVPAAFLGFEKHPAYEKIVLSLKAASQFGVENPFFRVHEGAGGATTRIGGHDCLNFASYDYLSLNSDPRLAAAAQAAMAQYGISAAASRLVAGERPVHRGLEAALAQFYEAEDCLAFVSGHATNVSTIATLFGPRDLVLHDELAHNSIIEGARLSGAERRSFPHNDWRALDKILGLLRGRVERVLIAIEGHYSMDGDTPDLQKFIEVKQKHGAILMVDEAHALGVLGTTGRGSAEHCGVALADVDIWMGTLSKTLCACGGYIAGKQAMIEMLRYSAPGFVYSVGLPPALVASAHTALGILQAEPCRVEKLRENGRLFLELARAVGLETGRAEGHAIIPVIIGSSLKTTKISQKLLLEGLNVQPIIPPAVEEKAARLRFFLCAGHTAGDLRRAIQATARLL